MRKNPEKMKMKEIDHWISLDIVWRHLTKSPEYPIITNETKWNQITVSHLIPLVLIDPISYWELWLEKSD